MKKSIKALSLICSAVCAMSFAACISPADPSAKHVHTYSNTYSFDEAYHWYAPTCNDTDELKDKEAHTFNGLRCTKCNYEKDLTFNEFTTEYLQVAQNFFLEKIRPQVVAGKDVKSESWYLNANEENKLNEATMVYTYKVDDTKRAVEVANISISPISLKDIVNNYQAQNPHITIDRSTAFEFDARENYNKQDIATALYKAGGNSKADLKLYSEIASSHEDQREFNILLTSDSNIRVRHISVYSQNNDEDLLESLSNTYKISDKSIVSTYTLNGTNIMTSGYELENIGGGSTIDPIAPSVTDAELVAALDENCMDGILNACFPVSIDKNNITNVNWYITKDSDGNITQAECAFNYQRSSTSAYYTIGKVSFNEPLTLQDLKDGKTNNATYNDGYNFNYTSSIQETRADLTNAICNKVFGDNEGATRYIVDNGNTANDSKLGTARMFTVVEITEAGVKEMSINIKNATNDAGYIANLNSEENYRTYGEKTYEISGNLLTDE